MLAERAGVPMDNSSGGKCELVIVFESLDLSYAKECMCLDAQVFPTVTQG